MKEHRGSVVDGEGKKKDQWGTDVVSEGEKTDQSGEINVAKGRRAAFEYTPTLFVYLIVRFIRSDFIDDCIMFQMGVRSYLEKLSCRRRSVFSVIVK